MKAETALRRIVKLMDERIFNQRMDVGNGLSIPCCSDEVGQACGEHLGDIYEIATQALQVEQWFKSTPIL